jgi:hypothetical protein
MGETIEIGMYVRYPRTGTTGAVTRIEEQHGMLFAEIEGTGLLYRADQLMAAAREDHHHQDRSRDEDLRQIEYERTRIGDESFKEAVNSQDGACHGGG